MNNTNNTGKYSKVQKEVNLNTNKPATNLRPRKVNLFFTLKNLNN